MAADSNQAETDGRGEHREETIHDLFTRVRQHPDFVFGTVFVLADFSDLKVPDDFSPKHAEEAIVERGNRLIADAGVWPEDD
jgi:hypothetical protein